MSTKTEHFQASAELDDAELVARLSADVHRFVDRALARVRAAAPNVDMAELARMATAGQVELRVSIDFPVSRLALELRKAGELEFQSLVEIGAARGKGAN